MLLGRVEDAGDCGGCWSMDEVRPRAGELPFVRARGAAVGLAGGAGGGGESSRVGESGGGGMSVPSVREKFRGLTGGSSNLFPLEVGIVRVCVLSQRLWRASLVILP